MLTLEDKFAIQELINRFAMYSDFGDWVSLETVFTPDVITEMDGIPLKLEGMAAQVHHAKESDRQTEGKNRHYYVNMIIDEVGASVVARYIFINAHAGAEPMSARIVTSGRQTDTVVKTDTGWKISHRYVIFDQSFELNF